MTTPAERITADQLAWARSEAEGTCRICDAPQLLRLLLAERDAVLADNERLTAELADTAARAVNAEDQRDKLRRSVFGPTGVAAENKRLTEDLASQRAVNVSSAQAFRAGAEQLQAELAEANRRAQAACDQRDGALAELAAAARSGEVCTTEWALRWPDGDVVPEWVEGAARYRARIETEFRPAVMHREIRSLVGEWREDAQGEAQGGLERDGGVGVDSDARGGPKVPQDAPTGFCPECGTAQPLDWRGSITGHGAPDADCADWCGGSWNYPARAEATHQ